MKKGVDNMKKLMYTNVTSASNGSRSLKTIQNQEERETAIFLSRSQRKDSQFEMSFELEGDFRRVLQDSIQDEHESLILAQDERWRRA